MEAAIAVAGITIQLADTLHKLITFWKEVQRAPADVCSLFEDVETLSALLAQAQSSNQHGCLDGLAETVLGRCGEKVAALYAKVRKATEGLTSESARKRKWSALKIALDKADITELRSQLKEAKAMLVIVKLQTFERSTSSKLQAQEQILLEILRSIRLPSIKQSNILSWTNLEWQKPEMQLLTTPATEPSIYTKGAATACLDAIETKCAPSPSLSNQSQKRSRSESVWIPGSSMRINTPFGPVKTWIRTQIRVDGRPYTSNSEDQDKTYAFYPSWLLRRLGISYGLLVQGGSATGWQYTIQPFNAVPDDAPIFRYCQDGDIAAIKTLLSCGYASLRDRDTKGRTPLWYASESLQVEVADFLLEHGADAHAVDWETNRSPIASIATLSSEATLEARKRTMMVTVFERHAPDGYDEASILYLIGITTVAYRPGRSFELCPAHIDRGLSFTQIVSRVFDFWCPDDSRRTEILLHVLGLGYSPNILHWLLSGIETIGGSHSASILHQMFKSGFLVRYPNIVKMAIKKMTNLHIPLVSPSGATCRQSTATSFAMGNSKIYFAWRDILLEIGHDLKEFVHQELENTSSPLSAQGWTQSTLLALFRSNDQLSSEPEADPICGRCGCEYERTEMLVDLIWNRYLQGVRDGRLRPVSTIAEVQHITVDLHDEKTSTISRSPIPAGRHDSMDLVRDAESLPYRMVCRVVCWDRINVSEAFGGSSGQDVILPPYPLKEAPLHGKDSPRQDENACPTKTMPGAFGD
ncbi:hypothetical protein BKA64DRAFT_705491 [Cadophora sp. MPI-SDFR-AT-0126]|nr:hypothetical protein BKA64DRAFT_705491 [Leotiomycetes sp. MPI-SDFR-AT-0126]